ncbi:Sec-independent protein translocase subunit TatA [Nonomuraea sp. NBC_01738]|uniref:Sec-independent protein translocase subunit TatA n=1 Tax=Nonomuraea sp. NBC_01738 TaxID=2976003 RepID=UPI002E1355F3|nr:Sec-independent protein translocase subunit TatA [Nonomuraea sp. NBC_01738]
MSLGPTEWIIIAVVVVLLFGAKKLPDSARAIGRSLRIFKSETQKLREDDDVDDKPTVVQTQAQPQPAAPQPQSIPAPAPVLSVEEQARRLEEEAAKLRATAQADKQA